VIGLADLDFLFAITASLWLSGTYTCADRCSSNCATVLLSKSCGLATTDGNHLNGEPAVDDAMRDWDRGDARRCRRNDTAGERCWKLGPSSDGFTFVGELRAQSRP
jgi:hypothetical protein